jgi:hypothetical protein
MCGGGEGTIVGCTPMAAAAETDSPPNCGSTSGAMRTSRSLDTSISDSQVWQLSLYNPRSIPFMHTRVRKNPVHIISCFPHIILQNPKKITFIIRVLILYSPINHLFIIFIHNQVATLVNC